MSVGCFGLGREGATVTVGSFDGVHLAHRAVLDETVRRAGAAGRASVLVTFEPHPLEVVRPDRAPPLLTTAAERRGALAETDVRHALVVRFDREVASLTPERFVREILVRRAGMRELVIGYDHGLGRDRSGGVDALRRLGATDGFEVVVVPPVELDGVAVSSSRVRRAVADGDLSLAARLLGRPYRLSGPVVPGEQRGRTLGVRTINLEVPPRKLLPPDGVYAVRVEHRGGSSGGMMHQGPRPTFGDGRRVLEAHLFGTTRDLYGEWVRIEWVARLRDVQRFGSPAELAAQLERDRSAALEALGG